MERSPFAQIPPMARSSSPIPEASEVLQVSSILPISTPQMLSNSQNVSIAEENTLRAVGGSMYNVSIATVHSLELALDGEFLIVIHD